MPILRLSSLIALTFLTQSASAASIKAVLADRAQEGQPAEHAFDTHADTRWAAQGVGRWIQLELNEPKELSKVGIGFARGARDYAFDIRTSDDGNSWSTPIKFQSAGKAEVVDYPIPKTSARFVRVTVFGSNANDWANIHTIQLRGVSPFVSQEGKANVVATEWASGPGVINGVGLSFDDHGHAYVTTVHRRKQSSLDIRNHKDLVKTDLSFENVEDRRAFYKSYLTGKEWVPDRNRDGQRDWQDLTVQKDTLTEVIDEDQNGTGETIRVLDEYHSEVTGIAAGVLAVNEDIFVAVEPEFLRYPDKEIDAKEVVADGLQVHIGQGGHNLSGVALGPDGRVYWSLADKGHYVKTKEGKTYHRPNSGAIFRCEMDGSNVERYSTGERNAQELAFDDFGNLFSMDNDGDYPGEMERALYITEGSEHGWRLNWQWLRLQDFIKVSGIDAYNPWMEERLFLPDHESHAAYLTPTLGNFGPGPCGFTKNPGTALSPELADCFFMTNQKGEVRVLTFHPQGAFFSFKEREPIKGGVNNTGLAFGPDGALYAASYGNKKGSIFRFDVTPAHQHPRRAETQQILAKDAKASPVKELMGWFDHPDQRVRLKGQFELARREDVGKLSVILTSQDKTTLLAKAHAIWGLGQCARRQEGLAYLLLPVFINVKEPELIAQAAKVLGDLPSDGKMAPIFRPRLREALNHASPRVRFFAAIALGNLRDESAAPALVKLLQTDGATDAYMRHAAIMGLTGSLSSQQLADLHHHPDRTVRLGAIVALRRQQAPEVSAFLNDQDELVLLEAARAIHDDQSIPTALPDLTKLLDRKDMRSEALIRRVINAAFRDGSASGLSRLVNYLKRGEGTPKLRRTALASILWWSDPPVLDPVEGRYRKHAPRDPAAANEAVAQLQKTILNDRDLLEVLLNGVIERREGQWLEGVMGPFSQCPPDLQSRYITALATSNSPDLGAVVKEALTSPLAKVREAARKHANQAGLPTIDLLLAVLNDPDATGKGKAILQLAQLEDANAQVKLIELAHAYRRGKADPNWMLELWQAAKSKGILLPDTPDRLEYGGNSKRGKKLVMEHAAAQCIRCHQMGESHAPTATTGIGPDLSKIGKTRNRTQLVASMLDPSREVSPGFGTVLLKTKTDQEIAGILSQQSDTKWIITLADGNTVSIPIKDIQSHTLTSVMPPMGLLMTPEEIRDVVSYLASLK